MKRLWFCVAAALVRLSRSQDLVECSTYSGTSSVAKLTTSIITETSILTSTRTVGPATVVITSTPAAQTLIVTSTSTLTSINTTTSTASITIATSTESVTLTLEQTTTTTTTATFSTYSFEPIASNSAIVSAGGGGFNSKRRRRRREALAVARNERRGLADLLSRLRCLLLGGLFPSACQAPPCGGILDLINPLGANCAPTSTVLTTVATTTETITATQSSSTAAQSSSSLTASSRSSSSLSSSTSHQQSSSSTAVDSSLYPQQVICTESSNSTLYLTSTISGTLTVNAASTPTSTFTITKLSTVALLLQATTTTTIYETTATVTYTSTSVKTLSESATATAFTAQVSGAAATAQCRASNIINRVNSQGLVFNGVAQNVTREYGGSQPSPAACCEICAAATDCTGFGFTPFGANDGPGNCAFYTSSGACNPAQLSWYVLGTSDFGVQLSFGNGQCGQASYASDGD